MLLRKTVFQQRCRMLYACVLLFVTHTRGSVHSTVSKQDMSSTNEQNSLAELRLQAADQQILTPNQLQSNSPLSGISEYGISTHLYPMIKTTLPDEVEQFPTFEHTEMLKDEELELQAEVMRLAPQILAGGRRAKKALRRLHTLVAHPDGKTIIKQSPVMPACKSLLTRTPKALEVHIRSMCGSIVAAVTDLPVANQIVDVVTSTAKKGVIDIVYPRPSRVYRFDEEVAKLRAGASVEDIVDGDVADPDDLDDDIS
eukprot:GILJ01013580.1.p1 GENE.GILJ01013580.1~~GILJ01013580.1.p1  ORF type:complete len:256 (+),score=27.19 GILJ01013580.1:45-812(+)